MAKYTMQLNLTPPAQERIDDLRQRTQMPSTKIVERLLTWLGQQDELIQLRVLGIMSNETAAYVSRLLLEQMAAEGEQAADHGAARPAVAAKAARRGRAAVRDPSDNRGRQAS